MSKAVYEKMMAHVQDVYPEEACGLLAGKENRISRCYKIENMLHSETAFEMDPLQQVRAMLEIEGQGLTLLAIYHSHPQGPAAPSATDVAQAYYPEAVQLIVSLPEQKRPFLRAFTIIAGRVDEVEWILQ